MGYYAAVKLRVTAGATGMPGPVDVDNNLLEVAAIHDDGLACRISSSAAP